jgi:hypothetical protein
MISRGLNLKIGDVLVERGIISKEQLQTALEEQKKHGTDPKK